LADNKALRFGLTYSPRNNINGQQTSELSRLNAIDNEVETLELGTSKIDFKLPHAIGFGVSYQRINLFSIGLDFQYDLWNGSSTERETYNDLIKISSGIEWIPDYDNITSYFKRAQYRFGMNYARLPYIVNEQSLSEFGINFGASLPVSGSSSLDLGFKFGSLGETTNGLIRETYYKIVLGATINDRWFQKFRYD
jgi:hypothetical protein